MAELIVGRGPEPFGGTRWNVEDSAITSALRVLLAEADARDGRLQVTVTSHHSSAQAARRKALEREAQRFERR